MDLILQCNGCDAKLPSEWIYSSGLKKSVDDNGQNEQNIIRIPINFG